jgi:hypothetical protein
MQVSLPEGLRWAETAAEEAGFEVKNGIVPKRWGNEPGTLQQIAVMVGARQLREDAAKNAWLTELVKKAAEAPPKVAKPRFGESLRFKAVGPNPHKAGTAWANRYDEMAAYVKANPAASVADMFAACAFTKNDYKLDTGKGYIKVDFK